MAEFDEADDGARARMRDLIKWHTEPRAAADGRGDEVAEETASRSGTDDQSGRD